MIQKYGWEYVRDTSSRIFESDEFKRIELKMNVIESTLGRIKFEERAAQKNKAKR